MTVSCITLEKSWKLFFKLTSCWNLLPESVSAKTTYSISRTYDVDVSVSKSRNPLAKVSVESWVAPAVIVAWGSLIANGCPATDPVPRVNVRVSASASVPADVNFTPWTQKKNNFRVAFYLIFFYLRIKFYNRLLKYPTQLVVWNFSPSRVIETAVIDSSFSSWFIVAKFAWLVIVGGAAAIENCSVINNFINQYSYLRL